MSKVNWRALEKKWQRKWSWSRIHECDPHPRKFKYFVTAAYPYPNSPQHIGHGRTYTIADVNARFHRMRGFNTLYPTGFHYTGTPVFAMCERLQAKDPEVIETLTKIYHVPEQKLESLQDPVRLARYFHAEIKKGMQEIGFSIDWRREFITIEPLYMRFIEWHFNKLRERGLITQGTHPVGWCPNDNGPVGQHDTQGDKDPEVGEYFLVKFESEGTYYPTATLRPETVFGVTNLWVNPDATYVKARVDGQSWVVSSEGAEKLRHQKHVVEAPKEITGKRLLWKMVYNPATKVAVPILPARFVAPGNGTGVVMSVPAHAPYDYQALMDIKATNPTGLGVAENIGNLKPIPIIRLEGWSEVPAADVVAKFGVQNQEDSKLENATEELYSAEFRRGVMRENTDGYAGMPISKARDMVVQDYAASGHIVKLFEILNRPVFCRCGTECIVHILDNQWFINYGDKEWKKLAHQCLDQMVVLPQEARAEFRHTVDWLKEKACARKVGLGTRLPWDKDWVIESLSDSVVYMAYYILTKYFSRNWTVFKRFEKDPSRLPDSFFDYILLGIGTADAVANVTKIPLGVVERIRKEFLYFYPVDMRHSGKDLIPNHLTFYIFHHSTLYPRARWPKGVVANGFVLMEGAKMSKSMQNITPLRDAVAKYGADPVRVGVMATAELGQDTDFSPVLVSAIGERLTGLILQARRLRRVKPVKTGAGQIEKWMLSRLNRIVGDASDAMEKLRVREAINKVLYELDNDLGWFLRRARAEKTRGRAERVLRTVAEVRAKLLSPVAPHTAEEMWSLLGNKGLVASGKWPRADKEFLDSDSEQAEWFIRKTLEDTGEILKTTNISPERVIFYTAGEWKWKIFLRSLEESESRKTDLGGFLKGLMADPTIRGLGKPAADYGARALQQSREMAGDQRKLRRGTGRVDEMTVLRDARAFFERELKAKVEVWDEAQEGLYDPKDRARLAEPYRAAIFVE